MDFEGLVCRLGLACHGSIDNRDGGTECGFYTELRRV